MTISGVAKEVGIANATIHNRYPDLAERIRSSSGVIKEKDVKSVLIIVKSISIPEVLPFHKGETSRDDSSARDKGVQIKDTTKVITMKDGRVFLDKQNGEVQSVDLFTYKPPILDFGLFLSAGVTFSATTVCPSVAISPLQICGAIQIPLIVADLRGVASGFSYRLWNFNAGIVWHYTFNAEQQLNLLLTYNL